MNQKLMTLLTGLLFLWIPLAHFYPSADAFLVPKDLVGLLAGAVLIMGALFKVPGFFRPAWARALQVFIAWMVLDGVFADPAGLTVTRGAIHLVLWLGAAAGILVMGEGEKDLGKMSAFALAAGAFMSLHGIFQTMGHHEADFTTLFENRAFSTLGNPDYLGGYLAALLPLAWVMTLRAKSPSSWWTLRLTTMILFVGLLVTRVRGSFVALAAAGIFIGAALALPWGKGLWRENKGFVLATLAIGLVGAGAFWFRHGGLAVFGLGQASFQQRWDLYRIAWAMVKDHPWTGVGLGQFALQFPRYQAKPWPDGSHPYIYSSHVHNEFLQFLAEGGIIGLLLFLAVLALYVRECVRYVQDPVSSDSGRTLLIGIGGGMVSLLVQSLTNFPLQVAPTAVLFGAFLAAPWALRKKEGTVSPRRGMAGIVILMVFFVLGTWSAREMGASIALRDTLGETGLGHGELAVRYGERAVALAPADPKVWSAKAKAHRLMGQGNEAVAAFQRAVALDPNDVDDRAMAADIFLASGRPQDAVRLCQEARNIAPNDLGVRWTLAVSQFQAGDFPGAVKSFEAYTAFSPNEYQAFLNLGVCYMRVGDREKAKAAWERAKTLNPGDPQTDSYLKSLNQKTK